MASPSSGQVSEQALAARAFARSLNMLLKYVRMYGIRHKRSSDQFEVTWKELRVAVASSHGLLIGVSGQKLLVDGVPIETGGAEKAFTDLIGASGIGSFQFLPSVTQEEFDRFVQAFSLAKPQNLLQQLKMSLTDAAQGPIRINELRYVQHDPTKPEGGDGTGAPGAAAATPMAAALTATAIADEKASKLGNWMSDPNKLLQLIIAAHGADKKGGGHGTGTGAGPGSDGGTGSGGGSGAGEGAGEGNGPGAGTAPAAAKAPGDSTGSFAGIGAVPEQEVLGILRWLTQMGKAEKESDPQSLKAAMDAAITQAPKGRAMNLVQQTLSQLASLPEQAGPQPAMLVKLAENLAIRFALERYERGEVKVNAVRSMLERMNKEMDDLRKVLSSHEETITKAGLSVESRAEILDRQFWAAVPERGKLGVLLTEDAYCIPARNVRSFVEELIARPDLALAAKVLGSYLRCITTADPEARRKCAIGLSDLVDLFPKLKGLLPVAVNALGEQLLRETSLDVLGLLCATFVRFTQEANNTKDYDAIAWALHTMQQLEKKNPPLAKDLKPRVAVEGRIREFIEEGLRAPEMPAGLLNVLRWTPRATVEHAAVRFAQCQKRQECERLLEIMGAVGDLAREHLRTQLTTRPPAEAAAAVGPLSRLDMQYLSTELPTRIRSWNRSAQDTLIRQLAIGGARNRGLLLTLLLGNMDPMIRALAIDEIGMSGDTDASPALLQLAQGMGPALNSDFLKLKSIEALGRLREKHAGDLLAGIVSEKSLLSYKHPRELRIAAAQALRRIDPARAQKVVAGAGLDAKELQFAPLEVVQSQWTRSRRHPRVTPRALNGSAQTNKGRINITFTGLSLAGGVGIREGRTPVSYEATIELPSGLRRIHGQVLVRENRPREVTFEIVDMDLEDLAKLRRLLADTAAG